MLLLCFLSTNVPQECGDEIVADKEGDADDGGDDLEPVVDGLMHDPFVDGVENLGAVERRYGEKVEEDHHEIEHDKAAEEEIEVGGTDAGAALLCLLALDIQTVVVEASVVVFWLLRLLRHAEIVVDDSEGVVLLCSQDYGRTLCLYGKRFFGIVVVRPQEGACHGDKEVHEYAAEIDDDALHRMDLAEIILEGVFVVGMVGMEAHIGSEWQPSYAEASLEAGASVKESETRIEEEAELGNSYAESQGCQVVSNLVEG